MKFKQSEIGVNLMKFSDADLNNYLELSVLDTDVLRTKVNKRTAELEELLRTVNIIEKKIKENK